MFVDKVGSILNEEAPLKGFQSRRSHRNWLSTDLKSLMEERNRKRELARNTGVAAHWMDFKKCINKCTKELERQITKHYREIFENCEKENDIKSIYKTTKNLLGWKSGGSSHSFLIEGRLYRRPDELANL